MKKHPFRHWSENERSDREGNYALTFVVICLLVAVAIIIITVE